MVSALTQIALWSAVEVSIYADDPIRVYLREMGAVALLTREGEVDLARRMERGKLRTKKAISRLNPALAPKIEDGCLDFLQFVCSRCWKEQNTITLAQQIS